jgi:transposase-like protein
MTSSSLTGLREDARMTRPGPRAGGPTSRRSFTSAQKLDHIAAYEAAMTKGDGGAYLRANGLYSSLMCEWRRQRDAGVLAGKKPGEKIGRLTSEQAEIARLRRQLDKAERRLATTEVALEIMGKARELLEGLTKSSRDDNPHTTP